MEGSESPFWIADLPKDSRGFHVPAEAPWVDGEPRIEIVDNDRKLALAMTRSCSVCGFRMPPSSVVYRAFAQGDAAQVRGFERERATDFAGPVHRSCILYSAMTCPYLRQSAARLGKASTINPGGKRGTRAAVMGFRDFRILIPQVFDATNGVSFQIGLVQLVEDLPYKDGDEFAALAAEAVESDAELIDASGERHYWTDSEADVARMRVVLKRAGKYIQTAEPEYEAELVGMGRYYAFPPLPDS